jgi:hypothetical protein
MCGKDMAFARHWHGVHALNVRLTGSHLSRRDGPTLQASGKGMGKQDRIAPPANIAPE